MYNAWVFKHKPKSLKEIVGNKGPIEKFVDWIKSWETGIPKKRAVFLYGPPGVGKTVAVEALANDLQIALVEKNASDYRTEQAVKRFAGLASQYKSLFGKTRIILLDELDGLTGKADKGGVKATTNVIKNARVPIVLIANNAYDPKFATIRKYSLLIEFKKPSVGAITKRLNQICLKEGITAEGNALKFIAQYSEGDVRSAINDLQALVQNKKELTYDDVSWLSHRNRSEVIFTVLKTIIYGKTCESAKRAINLADIDRDMLFEWIYENVPAHLSDPHDLIRAIDALSLADIYRGRIWRTQNWSLIRYVIDFMTAGVAMARINTRTSRWIPFLFPQRIKTLSKSKAERSMTLNIGYKIKRRCHLSAIRASKEVVPYLKIIFKNNFKMAAGLTKWFDLTPEMIDYLTEDKKKTESITKFID